MDHDIVGPFLRADFTGHEVSSHRADEGPTHGGNDEKPVEMRIPSLETNHDKRNDSNGNFKNDLIIYMTMAKIISSKEKHDPSRCFAGGTAMKHPTPSSLAAITI